MVHHNLYRKQFVRRNRLRLRHAAMAVAGVCMLYSGAALFTGKETAVVIPAQHTASLQTDTVAGEDSYTKPVTAQTPLASHLSSIETGINAILDSNNSKVAEKTVVVSKGDTLMGLLVNKADVPQAEAYQAVQALRKVYDPRNILPGREITVFFHKDPSAEATLSSVKIERDTVNTVTVTRDDAGNYKADNVEKEVYRSVSAFGGTINNSFYADARAAGVPDSVILEMIKLYSWNVDFQREIRAGDKFEVMYEEYKTEDGKLVSGRGNISYAKLTLGGTELPLYRFTDAQGDSGYFDTTGTSARRPLMKTPIDGARISSNYGVRKHPVLGFTKMHKGVDFAAATGTPIYAAGDGTVTRANVFGAYGKYVRIRHRNGLDTAYAHMSRFKKGLKAGDRVKQGEIIGYVGATGRVTGAHLHYEVLVNNVQVHPNSIKLPTGRTLKGKELDNFKSSVASMTAKFNTIGQIMPALAKADNGKKPANKVARKN